MAIAKTGTKLDITIYHLPKKAPVQPRVSPSAGNALSKACHDERPEERVICRDLLRERTDFPFGDPRLHRHHNAFEAGDQITIDVDAWELRLEDFSHLCWEIGVLDVHPILHCASTLRCSKPTNGSLGSFLLPAASALAKAAACPVRIRSSSGF